MRVGPNSAKSTSNINAMDLQFFSRPPQAQPDLKPSQAPQPKPQKKVSRLQRLKERVGDWLAANRDLCVFIGIIIIAVFFRFWRITTVPVGLHPDEAAGGLLALDILGGDIAPYYEQAGGKEGLFYFLQAASVALFGNTMWALRLVPALAGVAAVGFTYLAARAWFSRRVALTASFLLAISPWAVQFSRLALRESLIMLFVPLSLWIFAKAAQTNRAIWFAASGVIIGSTFYLHPVFYVLPLIGLALLIYAWFTYRERLKALWQPILIVILSMVVALLPLAAYVASHTDTFFEREGSSVFTNGESAQFSWTEFGKVSARTLGMFFAQGDENYLHNLGGEPHLHALSIVLIVLGGILAIRRWRDARYGSLIVLSVVFLLPAFFALPEEAPNAARAIGVLPLLYIVAGIGLSELFVRWRGVFPRNPLAYHLALSVIVITFGLATFYSYQRYFVAWANAPAALRAHHEIGMRTIDYLKQIEPAGTVYLAAGDQNAIPIKYLAHERYEYTRVDLSELSDLALLEGDILIRPHFFSETNQKLELPEGLKSELIYSPLRPHTEMLTIYRLDE